MVEEEPVFEFTIFETALLFLIGGLFHLYPRHLNSLLIMTQHYVLDISDPQP